MCLQGFNSKNHKHAIKYDTDETEHINLVTTARKWELDDSEPPAKGSTGQQGQAKKADEAKAKVRL